MHRTRCREMLVRCCFWLLLLWVGWALPAKGQTNMGPLFPKSNEVAGWTVKQEPKFFADSQLFDYMDGAAEIPKSYTFRTLGSAKYQKGNTVLEIAIFDMGSANAAYGYYSARVFLEHNPRSKERMVALDHPAHLYANVGVLTFWKDRYTVIIQPDDGKPDEAALLQLARAVSAKITAKGKPPELLRLLPAANRVANSERFVQGKAAFDSLLMFFATDVFGVANGPQAVGAEYNLAGGVATLFVIHYPNAEAANTAYSAYRQALTTRKAVFAPAGRPKGIFAAMDTKEKGTGAAVSGDDLCVVSRAKDIKAVDAGLQQLLAAVKAK